VGRRQPCLGGRRLRLGALVGAAAPGPRDAGGWPAQRTVGEFDGLLKYNRPPAGQSPVDVVVAEKLWEDAIRAEGLAVVRWTWQDLDQFGHVAGLLRRHLDG
jgi:hypothetical protein